MFLMKLNQKSRKKPQQTMMGEVGGEKPEGE